MSPRIKFARHHDLYKMSAGKKIYKRIGVTRNMSTKWAFVLYMDMCTPNTIDIGSKFSINQGSLVFDLGPVFL